jgi:AhpD family alkylhydroperoxidase
VHAAKKRGDVSPQFEKRIMLSVTQVNGCRLCSYYHTKEALKLGMPEQEIMGLLSGTLSSAPKEEAVALIFAQHYAETVGKFDATAWHRLVDTYGEARARSILVYIRIIMVGNAQGNIMGALRSRFRGHPELGSSFFQEIGVLLGNIVFIPFILIKSPILKLLRKTGERI